jgi:ribosomal protein L14E/L6E/L27E
MESVGKAPKVLDDKEVTLADIAKLAGIKEYVAPVKHSKKAEKMVESITAEPKSRIKHHQSHQRIRRRCFNLNFRSRKQSRKSPADWTR